VIIFILSLVSVICATTSPLLAANTVTISIFYKKSFTSTALLTGYHLLGVGVAGFLCVPTARVWGKRHVFLLGTIIVIASSAWGGTCGRSRSNASYNSLLWARVFQGVGLAPFEALVNAAVGDLYFVHVSHRNAALIPTVIALLVRLLLKCNSRNAANAWHSPTLLSLEAHSSLPWW
jgi:MFS family permease